MVGLAKSAAPSGLVLAALGWTVLARAAEGPPPDTPVGPVIIVATRTPTPIDEVASSVTLVTGQDIDDHQWRMLPDVLAQAPGLNLVQTGGPGGLSSVFIRGANSNHTKVVIDGIDANDPSEGAFDFGQVSTADLARVEVLRGPQSSLYGSDALGGVVNLVTREGRGAPKVTASLEGGAFDTLNETASVTGSSARLSYSASLVHLFSGDTPVTPLGLLAPGEARIGDRYDNLTASAKLGFALNDRFSLGVVARYVSSDLRTTGENFDLYPAPNIPDAAQTVQKTRQVFTRAEARSESFGGGLKSALGVGYTLYRTHIQAPDDGFGLPPPIINNGDRLKVDYLGTVDLGSGTALVVGAEDTEDRLLATVDLRNPRVADRAGWAELQTKPLRGLSFAASVRYDDNDRFGGKTTFRLAPTYRFAPTGTQLKATYGTGFKAPTLTQLFVSFPDFQFFANPRLKAETSEGYDIGFEQPLASGRLRLGAAWFHTVIRNLIETSADFTTYANIGRATTYGAESFVSLAVDPRLALRADYTYTVARDDIAAQSLLRRPQDKASLAATWRPTDRLSLSATLLYVGSRIDANRDFSIPRLRASPYATTDLAAAYELGRGVTLFARINNLLDRHYQDPTGFDRPGIGAFGGVRVSLP
jgi:vitamin B12 transporter